jgi:molecular chaperone Hsp33
MLDQIRRFLFAQSNIRGEIVSLEHSWQQMNAHHDYPDAVEILLGEMVAATVLLVETLKFDGKITLQATGNGPVTLIVAEATSDKKVRGVARWNGHVPVRDLHQQIGEGQIVISIQPDKGEAYQGVVPAEGASIGEALEHYLKQSEQLPTRLVLAANSEKVVGLLVQRLPEDPEDDDWDRVQLLVNTLGSEEFLAVTPETIITRLFHEDDIRLFEKEAVRFECGCSRERVASAIRGIGEKEANELIKQEGEVKVTCEYCNKTYQFDPIDVEQLFYESIQPVVSTKPQ